MATIAGLMDFGIIDVLPASLYINNGLNQNVIVQVKGNRINSVVGAVPIGYALKVNANSFEHRVIPLEEFGRLRYLYLELQCRVAPTVGSITAYLLKYGTEALVANALAIADITVHDPTSDPAAIIIVRW